MFCFLLSCFQASEIPGIKIFRFESSLYFANCENFRSSLYELTGVNPRELKKQQQKAEKKKKKMVRTNLDVTPNTQLIFFFFFFCILMFEFIHGFISFCLHQNNIFLLI